MAFLPNSGWGQPTEELGEWPEGRHPAAKMRGAPMLKFSESLLGPAIRGYSAPRRPSRIAPHVTV
jgi:hypothetical protein